MGEARPVVSIVGATVASQSGCRLLNDVTLECHPGEWTLLSGPSGAGKTTLLRAINGLCRLSSGRIETFGSAVDTRSRTVARAAWRRTGTVLQEIALFETKTARANVELGMRAAGADRRTARRQASTWLERLGLEDKQLSYHSSLSGGERQRVALARALCSGPKLLLLDEPTSALDSSTAAVVLGALKDLVDAGSTVIMSSHRENEVVPYCQRRVVLRSGRLVECERVAGATPSVVDLRDEQLLSTPLAGAPGTVRT